MGVGKFGSGCEDEMQKSLDDIVADETSAVAAFGELVSAKSKDQRPQSLSPLPIARSFKSGRRARKS